MGGVMVVTLKGNPLYCIVVLIKNPLNLSAVWKWKSPNGHFRSQDFLCELITRKNEFETLDSSIKLIFNRWLAVSLNFNPFNNSKIFIVYMKIIFFVRIEIL